MRAILTYHSVDPSGSVLSVDAATFRQHVAWLAGSGIRATSVADLLARPDHDNAVAVTFDDGYENFAAVAWPLLRDHGIPATVFVVPAFAGRTNAWDDGSDMPRLPLLSWDGLGRLAEDGVEIGAHTRTHANLRGCAPEALADEIVGARDEIAARVGQPPRGLAYPFGAYDAGAVAAARTAFDWACTADLDRLGPAPDRHRLPRLDAYYYRRVRYLEAWGTAPFRVRLRFRGGLRRLRRSLVGMPGGH